MAPDVATPGAEEDGTAPARTRSHRRWWVVAALAIVAATRLAVIYTESVNWDEFALMSRAARSAQTGHLHAGGRPGLGTAVLMPVVANCTDEIESVRRARLLWLAITGAFLAGFAALLVQIRRGSPHGASDAALGVAFLALVPAFLDWSIQVRTDQIALAAGAWGGVTLLASRRRPALAIAAGMLFGVGFLATQKLLYVGALAALLAAGDHWLNRGLRWRREAARVGLCLAGLGAVVAGYWLGFSQVVSTPAPMNVAQGLSAFDFYRNTIGYGQYRAMLPTLAPHGLMLIAMALASWAALSGRIARRPGLLLAWAALSLGLAVMLFHAAAFAYFWMTLGLFPAAAFTLALPSLRDLLDRFAPRAERFVVPGLWAMLAVPAVLQTVLLLRDTQAVQRRSFAFVHRSFARADSGFHPESGLFCQENRAPFPSLFSRDLYLLFAGDDREANAQRLIERFRSKPVKFLLESWRLNQFPGTVRQFWLDHYQAYRASVSVAGRRFEGGRGARVRFDLIVPGDYRWIPLAGRPRIAVDGAPVEPGQTLRLADGDHDAELLDDVRGGILVLALDEPYRPSQTAFYRSYSP